MAKKNNIQMRWTEKKLTWAWENVIKKRKTVNFLFVWWNQRCDFFKHSFKQKNVCAKRNKFPCITSICNAHRKKRNKTKTKIVECVCVCAFLLKNFFYFTMDFVTLMLAHRYSGAWLPYVFTFLIQLNVFCSFFLLNVM